MREIKFRAWDVDRHEYRDVPNLLMNIWGGLYWQFGYDFNPVDPSGFVMEQYTGMHDANGVEIYEGDIVQIGWHWSKSEALIQAVEYYPSSGLYSPFGTDDWSWGAGACEVIGNIRENPELLNGA